MTTNEQVHNAIKVLEKRVQEIKNKYGNNPILLSIQNLIGGHIADWLESEMDNNINDEYNERMMNKILDMIYQIRFYKE
jgi:hypothetical protein